jgi:hypothetical protein
MEKGKVNMETRCPGEVVVHEALGAEAVSAV